MKDIKMKTSLIKPHDDSSPLVVLNCVEDTGGETARLVRGLTDKDFGLICISGLDWNRDMSPWPSKAVFKGGDSFSGGADEYLRELTEHVIPDVLSSEGLRPEHLSIMVFLPSLKQPGYCPGSAKPRLPKMIPGIFFICAAYALVLIMLLKPSGPLSYRPHDRIFRMLLPISQRQIYPFRHPHGSMALDKLHKARIPE